MKVYFMDYMIFAQVELANYHNLINNRFLHSVPSVRGGTIF